ncbi:MAG: cytochrome C, partial [Bacteroidetes bacterium]
YMPEQPIKFSHKTHAGTYQINCQYCHSGASKSKSAWIPSVNVCMNCHKAIQQGAQYGTEEIAKIYEAAGYDPNEAAYTKEPQPIEWVRIHNLPDHAYFNHAQHVTVGNIECQTCHGPVEEMEVVYQYSNLGMGWCISCHRQEKVKSLGETTPYTVEDMGGLNCARCHY